MRLSGDQVRNAFDEYLDTLEEDIFNEEEPELQFLADNPYFDDLGQDEYD